MLNLFCDANRSTYREQMVHNCSVAVLHIKVVDTLSMMIQPGELLVLLESVENVIGSCIAQREMLKVRCHWWN